MFIVNPAWRERAQVIAAQLLADPAGKPGLFDIQRVFRWMPPDEPSGAALFQLAEALPRTPDRAGRLALLKEKMPLLRGSLRAALALPFANAAIRVVAGQFVFAQTIEAAVSRSARQDARLRYSFDMLGEGARTATDAARNHRRYLDAIACAGRTRGQAGRYGVSVKLSSIHPRYDAAAFPRSGALILTRLRELCALATTLGVGLTLDAEESERAPLQLELLAAVAEDPAFLALEGLGLAVQAYRTEAQATLKQVLGIARSRKAAGGAPLSVRLVKGAYWDAEVKRAQELGLAGYPVFTDKRDTDRSYLACAALLLENREAVFPQFATHNPVTQAAVIALHEASGQPEPGFEFQRLHGMGESAGRSLQAHFPQYPMRLYAPVGAHRDLLAYLVRRLLENGASTSYVRQAARAESAEALLEGAFAFLDPSPHPPRLPLPTELHMPERRSAGGYDLGDPRTLARIAEEVSRVPRRWSAAPLVDGAALSGAKRAVRSPAQPEAVIGEVADASAEDAKAAIASAYENRASWGSTPAEQRAGALDRLAELLEAHRTELMALCVHEAGKTLADALADVQEAVDFCRYYAAQARRDFGAPMQLPGPTGERNLLSLHPRGVFACISPWNFPVAIFTGQVAAALAAGNTVVAKPAEQTSLAAFRIAQLIHEAGIPPQAFHLLPGDGAVVGRAIVEDPRIAGVAFTGSNETATAIAQALAARKGAIVPLIAETGGMNAMIVDATALPEQVVDAVVASAFRSAGQRCSSLRVLYLQHEIAEMVLDFLRGAMAELRVGDPADPGSDIGPLIDAGARNTLASYVDELRTRAKLVAEAPAAGIPGSFLAPVAFEVGSMRDVPGERFGPILHVVRFAIEDLDKVVDEINATGYGLTMGIHTRVEARAEQVRRRAAVGNLYVNRNMIGAVVGVQPFGGEGLSGTGPKAGGPRYLPRFAVERVFTVNTAAAGGDVELLTERV